MKRRSTEMRRSARMSNARSGQRTKRPRWRSCARHARAQCRATDRGGRGDGACGGHRAGSAAACRRTGRKSSAPWRSSISISAAMPRRADRLLAMMERTDRRRTSARLQYRLLATVYIELGDAAQALKSAAAALEALPGGRPSRAEPYAQQARSPRAGAGGPERGSAGGNRRRHRATSCGTEARPIPSKCCVRNDTARSSWRRRAAMPKRCTLLRDLADRQSAGNASPVERGLVLDALGEAERKAGNGEKSQLAHEAARAELLKQLP